MPFSFKLQHTSGAARAGSFATDHGEVLTPVFMPVGTQATVKAVSPDKLRDLGAQIILGNTYHLYLRPGTEVLRAAGGLHKFMTWDHPILTDSGGYQVFSLAELRKVTDEGITFQSHLDGSKHLFSPEMVIETQAAIGADIVMSFDYCPKLPCDHAEALRSVELTTDWARRGRDVFGARFNTYGYEQVIFGICQGAVDPELRVRSMEELMAMDFPGYAIGGLSVGEKKEQMWSITELCGRTLPVDKPRYLMGVGTPVDLVEGVARGVDMFDCVLPTRNARNNGTVFTHDGRLVLKNAAFARDFGPIEEGCTCYTCQHFSRAYLRHLIVAGEILGISLATHHSLHFYCQLMGEMRAAIISDRFDAWRAEFLARFTASSNSEE